jgi:hypothetical protein
MYEEIRSCPHVKTLGNDAYSNPLLRLLKNLFYPVPKDFLFKRVTFFLQIAAST